MRRQVERTLPIGQGATPAIGSTEHQASSWLQRPHTRPDEQRRDRRRVRAHGSCKRRRPAPAEGAAGSPRADARSAAETHELQLSIELPGRVTYYGAESLMNRWNPATSHSLLRGDYPDRVSRLREPKRRPALPDRQPPLRKEESRPDHESGLPGARNACACDEPGPAIWRSVESGGRGEALAIPFRNPGGQRPSFAACARRNKERFCNLDL